MHSIDFFQIDAFTDKVFHGNPAAVCLLDDWLNDELLLAIAAENNLSETAFIIEAHNGFHIRWFTPNGEISLCGHATLAAGFVLFELERCSTDIITFNSMSGQLSVLRRKDRLTLDFPRLNYVNTHSSENITQLIDQPVLETYDSDLDYLILLANEAQVINAQIDLKKLIKLPKRGLIITSACTEADFYSRCFYPRHSISEDPVTGSAHCVLTPFWANKLNKSNLRAIQGLHRKGELFCELMDNRVFISGYCRWYLKGHLVI
ncbi:PhzF family phenazine biosynthesis protein [Legionella quateirensis]|uniref:Phenazine biosynthesis PhzF n=1 Tax=Legionella quateirensis TaxID=45072 RepID=A0A378KTC1_9GAMM|nr:PhzF family phenazine biosynthesis protein [Legionella quateirensis]KTD50929.1 phenazine biosynthesis PhzF [Legionella quateirensis]STY17825.1 phenazine biosynthesis PhzF [Legionella quateirensis]